MIDCDFFKVFSWGDGEYGKLGHGNSATQKYPKIIQGPLFSKVSYSKAVKKNASHFNKAFKKTIIFYICSSVRLLLVRLLATDTVLL